MAVVVLQRNDGAQSGVEITMAAPVAGWTDTQLIDWKRTSHEAMGWTVSVAQGGRRVTCTKGYDASERAKDPNLPAAVERVFRVV